KRLDVADAAVGTHDTILSAQLRALPQRRTDGSCRCRPVRGMNQREPAAQSGTKAVARLPVQLIHRVTPPYLAAALLYLVHTGARRLRRYTEPNGDRLELGPPLPLDRRVGLESLLQTPPRRQHEHDRQHQADEQRHSHLTFLTACRVDGIANYRRVAALKVLVDRPRLPVNQRYLRA